MAQVEAGREVTVTAANVFTIMVEFLLRATLS